jgi:hypothetical protein
MTLRAHEKYGVPSGRFRKRVLSHRRRCQR